MYNPNKQNLWVCVAQPIEHEGCL